MAEEHRCEASEGHRLCANNCGFFGSPAKMDLCSKCYRDYRLKEQQEASTKSTIEAALSASSSSSSPPSSTPIETVSDEYVPPPPIALPEIAEESRIASVVGDGPDRERLPKRCTACRKRVGLTGFQCRCGTTFCGVHRYPEKHGCSFDFKKVGKEEIARANPLVKADKLTKI